MSKAKVTFFLNGKVLTCKAMSFIPRVGEEIIFQEYDGHHTLKVALVVYDLNSNTNGETKNINIGLVEQTNN